MTRRANCLYSVHTVSINKHLRLYETLKVAHLLESVCFHFGSKCVSPVSADRSRALAWVSVFGFAAEWQLWAGAAGCQEGQIPGKINTR